MTSDNEKNSAVEKVVDAFRKRRAEGAGEPGESAGADDTGSAETVDETAADETPADDSAVDETPVVKVEAGEEPVLDSSVEVIEAQDGDSAMTVALDEAEADTLAMKVVEPDDADLQPAVVIARDPADAVAAADAPRTVTTEGGVVHEEVVAITGSGEPVQPAPRPEVESVDPDTLPRREIVEESVVTVASSPADTTPTEVIETQTQEFAAKTEQIAVPASRPDTAAAQGEWSSAPHQPKVIPGAAPAPAAGSRKGGRLGWILLALVVLAAIVALLWYFLLHNSPQNQAASAAKQYQTAMSEGDLATLREVTCGQEYAYYSSVSDAEFAKATASQRERNQMMSFKDITGVQVDGDTARVGVDVFNTADENSTTNAQVTLHKIDGKWKVCTKP